MAIDPGTATLVSTGANILAGAFGGNGSGTANLNMRRERSQRRGLYALENENIGNRLKATVSGAKAAGLHPLFAMGAGGGDSTQQFSMPGQSPQGNFAKDGLISLAAGFRDIAQMQAKSDLIDKMNEQQKYETTMQQFSNDTAGAARDVVLSKVPYEKAQKSSPLAEYKPAEIGSHEEGNRTATGSEWSPTSRMRIGDQDIYTLGHEGAEFAGSSSFSPPSWARV